MGKKSRAASVKRGLQNGVVGTAGVTRPVVSGYRKKERESEDGGLFPALSLTGYLPLATSFNLPKIEFS